MLRVTSLAFAAALGALTATAQVSERSVGEKVIDARGNPIAPWVEKKVCNTSEKRECMPIIVNIQTLEVARVGNRWTSGFTPTGNGKEGVRAEPTLDRARRLASSARR